MATTPVRNQDETRRKLLQAAAEVIAEHGYQAATVREICTRAGANVAAVNYHFGDKLALYTELLKAAVNDADAPEAFGALHSLATPEDALRAFISAMFRHITRADRPSWYSKAMAHELAHPTPALAVVVEHVIRPKARLLYRIVGEIIGRPALDQKTRLCAHSIIGQVVHYIHARPVIGMLWPELTMTPETMEVIANHIADFSLAALKGLERNGEPGTSTYKRAARRAK
jgi:TetR/AcrR family transcriptional regulator, regulator of cefoperazone and chloramphenicol sensitivity